MSNSKFIQFTSAADQQSFIDALNKNLDADVFTFIRKGQNDGGGFWIEMSSICWPLVNACCEEFVNHSLHFVGAHTASTGSYTTQF